LWTTTYGGFGFDVGGGVKIKLSERFAIRAEYRRYFIGDDDLGLNVILGGISVFF
jgi:opacity protein-like surface antigen